MKKKILFSLAIVSLFFGSSYAVDTTDSLDDYAKKVAASTDPNTFIQLANSKKAEDTESHNLWELKQSGSIDSAIGHETNALNDLVNSSDESYNGALARAKSILGDRDRSEVSKRIDKLAAAHESSDQPSIKDTSQKASDIIKKDHQIKNDFKSSHDFYKGKTVKDHIDKDIKNYNDAYQLEGYNDLLENIKTPEQIQKTFDEIDSDEDSQYKLSDGYSIEQITTVGLLTGQDKRLKKCLILKNYGGGTWRTLCQPLKKPTQCSDYDWEQLSTMAIMYC